MRDLLVPENDSLGCARRLQTDSLMYKNLQIHIIIIPDKEENRKSNENCLGTRMIMIVHGPHLKPPCHVEQTKTTID